MSDGSGRPTSLGALAKALGKTPRTLRRWMAAGMPEESDGTYDLERVRAWAAAQRKPGRRRATGEPTDDVERNKVFWEIQRLKYAALEKKTGWEERRGELVDREAVSNLLKARLVEFKRELLSAARRLAPLVVGRTDVRDVRFTIHQEHMRILWKAYGREIEAHLAPPRRRRGAARRRPPAEGTGEPSGTDPLA